MSEPWSYVVTPPARRDLRRPDPPVKRRIVDALDRFVADPFAADIRKLNPIEWRLRVGVRAASEAGRVSAAWPGQ